MMHATPHYHSLNSPGIASRASVVPPPSRSQGAIPICLGSRTWFPRQSCWPPKRTGHLDAWSQRLARRAFLRGTSEERPHWLGLARLLPSKQLQQGPRASGTQILFLHPATAFLNERQTVPQFPSLYARDVTSPTHLGKDLLLLNFFAVNSQSFTDTFWGIFSQFRGAGGTSKITQHLGYSSGAFSRTGQVSNTHRTAQRWRAAAPDTGLDQRSSCCFPRPGAKPSHRINELVKYHCWVKEEAPGISRSRVSTETFSYHGAGGCTSKYQISVPLSTTPALKGLDDFQEMPS